MAAFVDRVVVHVAAGNGGHGVAPIHREKVKPLGGPGGGNGGNGGGGHPHGGAPGGPPPATPNKIASDSVLGLRASGGDGCSCPPRVRPVSRAAHITIDAPPRGRAAALY